MTMNMNYDSINELLVTMLSEVRFQLFEPTDYSIIELCDMMLAYIDNGDPDFITQSEATEFALVTALRVVYNTIEKIAPGHFEAGAFRSEVARLAED